MLTFLWACVAGDPAGGGEGRAAGAPDGAEDVEGGDGPLDSGHGGDDDTGPVDDDASVGDWLYTPGGVLEFELLLSDDAISALYADPDEDVHAEFRWAGRSWEVGVHLKGNYSFRTLSGKPSFKVDFHEWDDAATFDGVRRLTLNNMIQDGSMLSEHGIYRLFGASDVAAPRHGYARLSVNGEWYGLYGIVETPDEQFLDRHFTSDEGNLYAGGYGADVRHGGADEFELEEQGDALPPWGDLDQMVAAVADAEDADLLDVLDTWFDSEALFRHFAVELVAGQSDGYVTWGNNFYLYRDPGTGLWSMIPWGQDQAFDRDGSVWDGWDGELVRRCGRVSACEDRVRDALAEVLDRWAEVDLAAEMAEVQAVIAEDCEADPRREQGCSRNQEEVLAYIRARPEEVWRQIR